MSRECSTEPTGSNDDETAKKIRIAVTGCSHGEMDIIYATLAEIERRNDYKFDLLICCGDYQAVRNHQDLNYMNVPEKYRKLKTFYRYYSGELLAPILTVFVGGNHEASGYLHELPYGGWVAPRIYYMGHASVVCFAGLRIAGLSGIYNKNHFDTGHWECPPFSDYGSMISVYHTRSVDVFRLKQLDISNAEGNALDIMITHDWPAGITDYGDAEALLRFKPYFEDDLKNNALGNPSTMTLVHCLELSSKNDDLWLSYDRTWLAILKSTDHLTSVSKGRIYMPSQHSKIDERWDFKPTLDELQAIDQLYNNDFKIPENFRMTAPPHQFVSSDEGKGQYYRNPQTAEFCSKLGVKDLNEMYCSTAQESFIGVPYYMRENKEALPSTPDNISDASFLMISCNQCDLNKYSLSLYETTSFDTD